MRTYSRDDVQTHYGSDRPAVNVKVYGTLEDGFSDLQKYGDEIPDGFTLEWVRDNFDDRYLDDLFWTVCGWQWEQIESQAEEIFGKGVDLEQDGRSGGWAVVTSLPDLEDWDAVALARWRKFERIAKLYAADIPYQCVTGLLYNEWEAREAEQAEAERAARQDIATVPA